MRLLHGIFAPKGGLHVGPPGVRGSPSFRFPDGEPGVSHPERAPRAAADQPSRHWEAPLTGTAPMSSWTFWGGRFLRRTDGFTASSTFWFPRIHVVRFFF